MELTSAIACALMLAAVDARVSGFVDPFIDRGVTLRLDADMYNGLTPDECRAIGHDNALSLIGGR